MIPLDQMVLIRGGVCTKNKAATRVLFGNLGIGLLVWDPQGIYSPIFRVLGNSPTILAVHIRFSIILWTIMVHISL